MRAIPGSGMPEPVGADEMDKALFAEGFKSVIWDPVRCLDVGCGAVDHHAAGCIQ